MYSILKYERILIRGVLEREIAIHESTPSSFFQAIFNLNTFTSIIENYIWCLQRILPDLEDSKIWSKIINPISEYENIKNCSKKYLSKNLI